MHNQSQTCFQEFARYCTLNVLGMVGLSCYILADTFFISKGLGAAGLASLNLAIPVYSFIHGSGLMLGMGGATRYTILKSQQKHREADRIFTSTILLTAALSIVFFLAGILFSRSLTIALGADAETFRMTYTYLRILLLFAPAFMLNDVLICFVRNDGSPRLSMLAMLGGSLSNILLDYVLIFPLRAGMFGAVFATGLAAVISILILSLHRIRRQNQFHLIKEKPDAKSVLITLSLGFPSLIAELSSGIVIIAFNRIILGLSGNVGVAAYGIIANLSLVISAVYTGIAQGIQPLLSRFSGRRDDRGTKQVLRYALTAMAILSGALYLLLFVFAGPVAGIFNSGHDNNLQAIATAGLKLYFTAVPFLGFNIIVSVFFTSTERAIPAHVISLLRGLILILPTAFFLSAVWGMTGVWLAFPVTEGLTAALGLVLYARLTADRGDEYVS